MYRTRRPSNIAAPPADFANPGPKEPFRILGIDPGSRFTGYGLVERQGSRTRLLAHGRIVLPPKAELGPRLAELSGQLAALVEREQPRVAALETLFLGVNIRSAIVLAHARGAILATLASAGLTVREYAPAQVKAAVAGSGSCDKVHLRKMVGLVLGIRGDELEIDASDALALAICLGQHLGSPWQKAVSMA